MDFLDELAWRGLLKDATNIEGLRERLKKPIVLYCGFDPTAKSLHVGHLQQLILLKRYQREGHHPIALLGGGTGMIGDPRPTTERQLLSDETLQNNLDSIAVQVRRILSSDDNPVRVINNRDWLEKLSIFDFLRDYGKHFSIATMLAKETISSRLETGISFTEFSYTILQAIDFLKLFETEHCQLQIGGSDQWGNLVSGTELIRRVHGSEHEVFAVTSPLIMRSDGQKFGKSEGANIWLNEEETDAYTFYQYWVNIPDADVADFMRRLSMKSITEIEAILSEWEKAPHKRFAQIELAKELTLLVHGQKGLDSALRITEALFSGQLEGLALSEIESAFAQATKRELTEAKVLVDALVDTQIIQSKREARQLIREGAIWVNGKKIMTEDYLVDKTQAFGGHLTIIRRGKKTYHVLEHQ